MDNVRVRMVDLPLEIKAYTIFFDDFYTIIINEKLSYEQRRRSYLHELEHITNCDFESMLPTGFIEVKTHK